MFVADLQKAYDKEVAMGRAQRKYLREMRKVDTAIKDLTEREEKKDQFRKQTIEHRRSEIRQRMNVWDQRREDVKNKEWLITTEDYKTFVPKAK